MSSCAGSVTGSAGVAVDLSDFRMQRVEEVERVSRTFLRDT